MAFEAISSAGVGLENMTRPLAIAVRWVEGLAETETMCAAPDVVRCGSCADVAPSAALEGAFGSLEIGRLSGAERYVE